MVFSRFAFGFVVVIGLVGCNPAKEEGRVFKETDNVKNTAPPAPAHDHGPNGGHVLELGKEEFHAEVAMDKDRKLTIYLFDEAMKAKPVENGTLQISTKIDAKDVVLDLVAAPVAGEADGNCSRFELAADKVPGAIMDIEGLTGDLTLKFGDKTLKQSLTAEHDDHAGHAH